MPRYKDERGDVSTYLAFAFALIVLVIVFVNFLALGQVRKVHRGLERAGSAALLRMEIDGYLSPAAQQILDNQLQAEQIDPAAVGIDATSAPVYWGNAVHLKLTYNYSLALKSWPGGIVTIPLNMTLRSTHCGTSHAVPQAP